MSPLETQASSIETPTPKVEQTQKTPEQIQERILQEALEKYGVNLKEYIKDSTKCDLENLKQALETTSEEQLIEQKTQELYQEYVNRGLDKGKIEEVVSLDALSKSIDSPRLEEMKNLIEKVLDDTLKKYDFLDAQTKELVKIGIVNSMLKSPMAEIGESLIGGVGKFIQTLSTLDPNDIGALTKKLNNVNPKDSGRVLSLEEEFGKKLGHYTEKFDNIKSKLDGVRPELTQEQKQNIISHVDWFRSPASIEAGGDGLSVDTIDITKTTKNQTPLDTKSISEYMVNSREKLLDVSKKLNLGDKVGDTVYSLIDGGGVVGEGVQKILEVMLKIPFLGKFLAIFLGLNSDPAKALSELKENSSNFKYLSSLKSLGISKNEQGKTVEGKGIFKDIDLSQIHFNGVKDEIKDVKAIFGDVKDEELSAKWQEAFSKGIEKDGITLKFELGDKKDGKLSSSELKKIIKEGLGKYNGEKEKKEIEADTKKRKEEETENTKKIQDLDATKDTLQSQIDSIDSIKNKNYEKIRHWDDILNVGDINDIKVQDIINHDGSDFGTIIKTNLKTGNLNDLSSEDLKLVNTLFSYIKEYCKEKSLSNQGEIKDFLKNNETGFNTWLDAKKAEFIQQKEGKQKEHATLTGKEKELKFARSIGEKIKNATDGMSLLGNGIEIGEDKKLSFSYDKQELNIGNDTFKIDLVSDGKQHKLKDIKITSGKVEFVPDIEDWELTAARNEKIGDPELGFISKEKVVNGITDLITKGNFIYQKGKTKLSFSKVETKA